MTDKGRAFVAALGVDLGSLQKGRRPLCRACLDWSERRTHLGGALGAALLDMMADRQWLRREEGRVIRFSPAGTREFQKVFPV